MLRFSEGAFYASPDPDGSFRFDGVPPGDYTIIADSSRPIGPFSLETARVRPLGTHYVAAFSSNARAVHWPPALPSHSSTATAAAKPSPPSPLPMAHSPF